MFEYLKNWKFWLAVIVILVAVNYGWKFVSSRNQ